VGGCVSCLDGSVMPVPGMTSTWLNMLLPCGQSVVTAAEGFFGGGARASLLQDSKEPRATLEVVTHTGTSLSPRILKG